MSRLDQHTNDETVQYSPDSLNDLLDVLARRGLVLILHRLNKEPLRYNELARALELDNKQLSRALVSAQREGLVARSVNSTSVPVQVHYKLTRRGHELVELLIPLIEWSAQAQPCPPGQ